MPAVPAVMYNNAAALASEIEIMHEDFQKASGGEPFLPKSKLKALLEAQAPGVAISDEQAAAFAGDCDDKISFDEYVCAVHGVDWVEVISQDKEADEDTSSLSHQDRWGKIFDKAAFEDGTMDKPEFRRIKRLIKARNATSRVPEGRRIVDQTFEEIDTNNDGRISKAEFFKMIEAWQKFLPKAGGETMQDHILIALEKSSKKSDFFIVNDRKATLDAEEEGLVKYLFQRIDQALHLTTSL